MILSWHVCDFDSTCIFRYNDIIPFLYSNVYGIQYSPTFHGVILIISNKRLNKLKSDFYSKVCIYFYRICLKYRVKIQKLRKFWGESQKISDNHGNTSQLHKLLYKENSKVIKMQFKRDKLSILNYFYSFNIVSAGSQKLGFY